MTIVPLTPHCLSHMFKEQLQGAGDLGSYRSFFESNSTFLGFVLQVPLVPKEVARWATDERNGFLGAAIKHDSSYGYIQ
jgi:hypothetical protein